MPKVTKSKIFVQHTNSLLSWGLPLLMLAVAAAFKYKEHEIKLTGSQVLDQLAHDVATGSHCW